MTTPWSRNKSGEIDRQTQDDNELRMIPWWSVLLAIVAFAAMQFLFHGVLPHHKHEMLPMRLLMGYTYGTLVASYVFACWLCQP